MDFKNEARFLFTASSLEAERIDAPHADPRSISEFKELENAISQSLKKTTTLVRTQTVTGVTLPTPKVESRGLRDEELVKKLLQYRDKAAPLASGRVIRKRES